MGRRQKYSAEQIITKLREAEVLLSQRKNIAEVSVELRFHGRSHS